MNNQPKKDARYLRMDRLKAMIVELEEDASLAELQGLLDEGVDPRELLACCMEGMHEVGLRFETGSYYIAALIMAGEIMRSATEILGRHMPVAPPSASGGRVMIGTVQDDIHDLGKNIVSLSLQCHGIEVIDLGVDVPAQVFLQKARDLRPDIIGLSCVLTNSLQNLKHTVSLLREELPGSGPPIIIGGTCLDEHIVRHIGATFWARDFASGLKITQDILSKAKSGRRLEEATS